MTCQHLQSPNPGHTQEHLFHVGQPELLLPRPLNKIAASTCHLVTSTFGPQEFPSIVALSVRLVGYFPVVAMELQFLNRNRCNQTCCHAIAIGRDLCL
jgi:hypothetical protein